MVPDKKSYKNIIDVIENKKSDSDIFNPHVVKVDTTFTGLGNVLILSNFPFHTNCTFQIFWSTWRPEVVIVRDSSNSRLQ